MRARRSAQLAAHAVQMRDLWAVYDGHHAEMEQITLAAVESIPELKAAIDQVSGGHDPVVQAQNQESARQLLQAAMVDGQWDAYLLEMEKSGHEYARAGIQFSAWTVAITAFRTALKRRLKDAYGSDLDRFAGSVEALGIFLDSVIATIGDAYLRAREDIIKDQQAAIRELSTPVLLAREGLLVLPIIGIVDTDRARNLTVNLLSRIRSDRARVVIMDLTGVPAVDSAVANHLLLSAKAARLLGARAIITGLSTANAETLARLGVDLSEVETLSDLETGMREADRQLKVALAEPHQ